MCLLFSTPSWIAVRPLLSLILESAFPERNYWQPHQKKKKKKTNKKTKQNRKSRKKNQKKKSLPPQRCFGDCAKLRRAYLRKQDSGKRGTQFHTVLSSLPRYVTQCDRTDRERLRRARKKWVNAGDSSHFTLGKETAIINGVIPSAARN